MPGLVSRSIERYLIYLCMYQPSTLVHTVHCELYLHVTLGHMISILVEYIDALTYIAVSILYYNLPLPFSFTFSRSSHIRQYICRTSLGSPLLQYSSTWHHTRLLNLLMFIVMLLSSDIAVIILQACG
jgi:hypothetical protein